jgi:molybdopterin-binding protein
MNGDRYKTNQIKGKIAAIETDEGLTKVTVQIGEHCLNALIVKNYADNAGFSVGDPVTALIKTTEVLLFKEIDQ